MRWKPESGRLLLVSATDDERRRVEEAAARFGLEHPQAGPLAIKLRDQFAAAALQRSTVEQFSKWLDTGGSYDAGQVAAQDLSRVLFGRVIERMLEQSNRWVPLASLYWSRLRGTG
jgi:hypothetical protein